MAAVTFICTPVRPYNRFELGDWLQEERAAGRAAAAPVTVHVVHPDKEADGSCRWCGDTRPDLVTFD
jgi:hypothetical protein